MFQFSSKTCVQQKFKLNDLLKLVRADKEMKLSASNIESIVMINALSEATTGLKPSVEVNEIYVIKVVLRNENVPYDFIRALDKTIKFQVLFQFICNEKEKYLTTYKIITDEKLTQIRMLESDWKGNEQKELPLVANLTELYKAILKELYSLDFRQGEAIKIWFERIAEIERLEKEFKKTEKMMNSETQPKKVFELNEKSRKIYEQIKELKE